MNPLLQVGSGSDEKSTGSGWAKINGSDRIRILIPGCTPANDWYKYALYIHLCTAWYSRTVPLTSVAEITPALVRTIFFAEFIDCNKSNCCFL